TFIRVRSTYGLGADKQSPIRPDDYDALDELRFVTDIAIAAARVPGAIAVFNPSGELIRSADALEKIRARERSGGEIGVDAWVNVRMFRRDGAEEWLLFDTVGMAQLDLRDHEVALPPDSSTNRIAGLLHSIAEYDAERGGVLGVNDSSSDSDDVVFRAYSD